MARAVLLLLLSVHCGLSTKCQDTWMAYGNNCFKFVDRLLSWQDAENECISMSSHLATIRNSAENIFFTVYISMVLVGDVWIGGFREDSDSSPITLYEWCPASPKKFTNGHETANCIMFSKCGKHMPKLKNEFCNVESKFICERS